MPAGGKRLEGHWHVQGRRRADDDRVAWAAPDGGGGIGCRRHVIRARNSLPQLGVGVTDCDARAAGALKAAEVPLADAATTDNEDGMLTGHGRVREEAMD
jgi:hypothetical protein